MLSKSLPQVFHDRDHLDQGETVRASDLFIRWRRYARRTRKLRLHIERNLATAEAKCILGDRLRPWVAQEKKRGRSVPSSTLFPPSSLRSVSPSQYPSSCTLLCPVLSVYALLPFSVPTLQLSMPTAEHPVHHLRR